MEDFDIVDELDLVELQNDYRYSEALRLVLIEQAKTEMQNVPEEVRPLIAIKYGFTVPFEIHINALKAARRIMDDDSLAAFDI